MPEYGVLPGKMIMPFGNEWWYPGGVAGINRPGQLDKLVDGPSPGNGFDL
jgi:hypothetical protein